MKILSLFFLALASSISAMAQTPIDGLQKQNLNYLESRESEGYEFRSQIITEFDQANASQNVNIKLTTGFTYIILALGDSNIPSIDLSIKPSQNAKIESLNLDQTLAGQSYELTPSKSGNFKIAINAGGLGEGKKGFISFMVLRK